MRGMLMCGMMLTVLVTGCITEPDGGGNELGLPDLSGDWTVSLHHGRLNDVGSDPSECKLEPLAITLSQHDTLSANAVLPSLVVTGTHLGGSLICTGVSERERTPPFADDTVLVIGPGPVQGVLGWRCDHVGFAGMCAGESTPTLDLIVPDVAPASEDLVRYHFRLLAAPRSTSYLGGRFILLAAQAGPETPSDIYYGRAIMDGYLWGER